MYEVLLTDDASEDLNDIYQYISSNDSYESADYVLDNFEALIASLAEQPSRGSYPNELSALGIKDFRQLLFKPYRLIYSVVDQQVVIYCVLDGRRDIQAALERRLLS
jgi:toxin ParE1/3/4